MSETTTCPMCGTSCRIAGSPDFIGDDVDDFGAVHTQWYEPVDEIVLNTPEVPTQRLRLLSPELYDQLHVDLAFERERAENLEGVLEEVRADLACERERNKRQARIIGGMDLSHIQAISKDRDRERERAESAEMRVKEMRVAMRQIRLIAGAQEECP